MQAFHFRGSYCRAGLWGARTSVTTVRGLSGCGSRALERRPSASDAQAQLLRSMQDLPGSGIQPLSPALADGLVTIEPPGEPSFTFFINYKMMLCIVKKEKAEL